MPTKTATKAMTAEQDALKALDKADRAIAKFQASKGGARAAAASIDPAELCKLYKQIKPLVSAVLPLVEAIPVYGAKIASVIRVLMQVADAACL